MLIQAAEKEKEISCPLGMFFPFNWNIKCSIKNEKKVGLYEGTLIIALESFTHSKKAIQKSLKRETSISEIYFKLMNATFLEIRLQRSRFFWIRLENGTRGEPVETNKGFLPWTFQPNFNAIHAHLQKTAQLIVEAGRAQATNYWGADRLVKNIDWNQRPFIWEIILLFCSS